MATVTIQRQYISDTNFFGWCSIGQQGICWCTIPSSGAIDPDTYTLDPDQQDNLDWFYENGIEFDSFGRRHMLQVMQEFTPDTVTIIAVPY